MKLKLKNSKKIKKGKFSSSTKKTTKNRYQEKLNKIEGIYKNYLNKYSALSQKRSILFNNLVKNIEQKKIEALRKNINQ